MPEFRPDRLATLHFFDPLRRLLGRAAAGIPILMYHSISETSEANRLGYFRTSTDPRTFTAQMAFLARENYRVIGLGEAVRRIQQGTQAAGRFVALTFDDGFRDFYTQAFPVLSAYRYTATVYLPTAYIGHRFDGRECLTWGEVRELRKHGVEFGSHTVTHPQLRTRPPAAIRTELRRSKQEIEQNLGEPVQSFSYPYAFPEADPPFRRDLRDLLVQTGYQNGVSTIIGTAGLASDRLFLERLPVNSGDDTGFFQAKLRGGYDWLHAAQTASKRVRQPKAAIHREEGVGA